jgi:hypothetical protein
MVEGGSVQPLQATVRHIGLAFAIAAIGIVVAAASARQASAAPDCATVVLDEWTSGTLTTKHPADCYEAAIDALPEDLRAYTSAADDISRALIAAARTDGDARRLASTSAAGQNEDVRAFPALVVGLVGLVALLGVSGLAASAIRRRRAQ